MDPKTNNRVEYIDALRGITMIFVVYHHVAYWCLDNIDFGYNEFFYKLIMPTFFFISGWVFYNKNRIWDKDTVFSILRKKFRSLIIPFLFFMPLYMYLFNGPEYQTTFDSKCGFWFIFSLFQYFVIYIGIEALFNKEQSNKKEVGVMLFMLVLSIISFYYEQVRFDYSFGIVRQLLTLLSFGKIKFIIFFWLGTYAKKNYISFIRITNNQYIIAICLCLFFLFGIKSREIYNSTIELKLISFLFAGITGTVIIFTYFRKNQIHFTNNIITGKALQYIGRRTLDIYLLHYFVLPYHMHEIGVWLFQHSYKSIDMLIILILSLWIISISLIISQIIRLSPFLGHYLFGAEEAGSPNKTNL